MYVDIQVKCLLVCPIITEIVSKNFSGARDGAVGWGTAPQDGRFRVRFPVGSLEFSSDQFFLSSLHILWEPGKVRQARIADNSAILVVSNGEVRSDAQRSEPSWLVTGKLYKL